MSEEESIEDDFTPYTALPHDKLDTWGFIPNTRVWGADNSFRPVQALEAGDRVFGVTFMKEDVMIPDGDDGTRLAKAWRPQLTSRKVLGVRAVEARAWQMTFGDVNAQYDARRLVAGGMTCVGSFPFDHNRRDWDRMVDLHTALENPRNGSETREAKRLDKEWSAEAGEPKYRPTEFSGQPRGDQAVIIPYEAFGGQTGQIKTSTRDYKRFVFSQVREVDVLHHKQPLIQVHLQPDTEEKFGASEESPRVNMIAQTPFRSESETVTVKRQEGGSDLKNIKFQDGSDEEASEAWNSYVNKLTTGDGGAFTQERVRQGSFYETKDNEEIAEDLKEKYGLEGGFLNGGILVNPPLPKQYR